VDTPPDELNRILDVNVTGCLRYARTCLPHLERRRGSIMHVASDAGVIGDPRGASSASKAAVIMLGKMLAVDCGRRGVRSNVICSGDIAPARTRAATIRPGGRCRRSAASARRLTSRLRPSSSHPAMQRS
jgi:NAD(P)-dependent dehydrogenase (short-subunit alcohol dehydrogenase family)